MGRTLNMTLRGEAGREGAWHGAAVGGFWLGRGIVTTVGGASPGPARRFHPAGCTPSLELWLRAGSQKRNLLQAPARAARTTCFSDPARKRWCRWSLNEGSSLPVMSGRGIQQEGLQSGALTPTSSIQALKEGGLCHQAPGSLGVPGVGAAHSHLECPSTWL